MVCGPPMVVVQHCGLLWVWPSQPTPDWRWPTSPNLLPRCPTFSQSLGSDLQVVGLYRGSDFGIFWWVCDLVLDGYCLWWIGGGGYLFDGFLRLTSGGWWWWVWVLWFGFGFGFVIWFWVCFCLWFWWLEVKVVGGGGCGSGSSAWNGGGCFGFHGFELCEFRGFGYDGWVFVGCGMGGFDVIDDGCDCCGHGGRVWVWVCDLILGLWLVLRLWFGFWFVFVCG